MSYWTPPRVRGMRGQQMPMVREEGEELEAGGMTFIARHGAWVRQVSNAEPPVTLHVNERWIDDYGREWVCHMSSNDGTPGSMDMRQLYPGGNGNPPCACGHRYGWHWRTENGLQEGCLHCRCGGYWAAFDPIPERPLSPAEAARLRAEIQR